MLAEVRTSLPASGVALVVAVIGSPGTVWVAVLGAVIGFAGLDALLAARTTVPVIERKLEEAGEGTRARQKTLLDLKVCDVACGSGHFLLAAARRVAQNVTFEGYAAALPALDRLKRVQAPLVLCSSKTRAEMIPLWQELGLDAPLITENGGGVFAPASSPLALGAGWDDCYLSAPIWRFVPWPPDAWRQRRFTSI